MQYYCVKRGGMTKQKYGRHIRGRYDNKHAVGIMLNKKWSQRIIDTEYINGCAISATQRIKMMSVYFTHSVYADHHIEKMCRTIEKQTTNCKNTYRLLEETSMLNWDLDTEQNVLVLSGTHSTRETKEVNG